MATQPIIYNTDEYSEHTDHACCSDMTCPCHENQDNINQINQYVQDGLASVDDANRIYRGQTV